jgi:predicted ATP-dependent endonuclease of OLD family
MKLRYLKIKNFRGIKECEWWIKSDLVCLVGPGDSTKTTLLSAVGLALSRHYVT